MCGDRVDFSWLLTNLFRYHDGTSLTNESSVALSPMEDIEKDEEVGRHWSILRLRNLSKTAYMNPFMMSLAVLIAGARILQG